jgi:hypothetical protein
MAWLLAYNHMRLSDYVSFVIALIIIAVWDFVSSKLK